MPPSRWLDSHKPLAGAYLPLAVALGAGGGLLLIVQAWLLAKVVDGAIFRGAGLAEVQPWLWSLLVIYLARAVLAWLAERAAFRGAARRQAGPARPALPPHPGPGTQPMSRGA